MPDCIVCGVPLSKNGKMFGQGTRVLERLWMPEYVCDNDDCGAKGAIQLVNE